LFKLEKNHLALEDHLRTQVDSLETELEHMLLVCQDLMTAGSLGELNAEQKQAASRNDTNRVDDLERELRKATAEADHLRRKVSELEQKAAAPKAVSKGLEAELKAQVELLEKQLTLAEKKPESSDRVLPAAKVQLLDNAISPPSSPAERSNDVQWTPGSQSTPPGASLSSMQLIRDLRVKHSPKIQSHSENKSTVGLVVEGLEISAVVPGGPLDQDFNGIRVEPHDLLVAVDGKACEPETLFRDLLGDDVVGSPVRITIKKAGSSKHVDLNVIRGSVARIQAIGELYLLFTEVMAAIASNRPVLSEDIIKIEDQAKVVNDFSTNLIDSFRAHVHDLEDAVIRGSIQDTSRARLAANESQSTSEQESKETLQKQLADLQKRANEESKRLRRHAASTSAELAEMKQRADTLQELMTTKGATHARERDEMAAQIIANDSKREIVVAKLELELSDANDKLSNLRGKLEAVAEELQDCRAKVGLAEAAAVLAGAKEKEACERARLAADQLHDAVLALEVATSAEERGQLNAQELQRQMSQEAEALQERLRKSSKIVQLFADRALRKWIMAGMSTAWHTWCTHTVDEARKRSVIGSI
jgi:hypothetical protein